MREIKEFDIQDINRAAPDLSRTIEQNYALGKVLDVKICEVGDTNRNFRVLCEKDGVQRWYFAKLFSIYKTLEKLNYENELYHYFDRRAQGEMDCPLPIPAKNGETVFKGVCQAAKVSAFFVVFRYLRGRTVDEALWRSVMKDGYLKGFAQGLASFHDFAYGFKPSVCPAGQTTLMEDSCLWEKAISVVDILKEEPRTRGYYEFFKPQQAKVLSLLRRNRAVIEKNLSKLPVCITHGDCSPNNYMYEGNEELTACGVCDFDWTKERPRIFDVSWMMCEVLSIFDPETGKTDFQPARMVQFVRDYNDRIIRSCGFVPGPISREELAVIPEMMELLMIQMAIHDRIGYMLENNQKLGGSEENIGVTYWGMSIIDGIEENRETIRAALSAMEP